MTGNTPSSHRVPSKGLLYVVAGNYKQAVIFAQSRGFHSTRMVVVDDRHKVMGLRGITLHVVGTAPTLENFQEIIKEAQIRDFTVEYV